LAATVRPIFFPYNFADTLLAADDSKGYFVEPTVILTEDPKSVTMVEEIFGPVLTVRDVQYRRPCNLTYMALCRYMYMTKLSMTRRWSSLIRRQFMRLPAQCMMVFDAFPPQGADRFAASRRIAQHLYTQQTSCATRQATCIIMISAQVPWLANSLSVAAALAVQMTRLARSVSSIALFLHGASRKLLLASRDTSTQAIFVSYDFVVCTSA